MFKDYKMCGFDLFDLSVEFFIYDKFVEVSLCYCFSFMDFFEDF